MKDNVKNWFKGLKTGDILLIIGGLLVLTLMSLYFFGYNLKDIFLFGRTGKVTIELPLFQTNIFIDEEKKITTTKENELVELNLSPRKHSVIISRDGYYPWAKEISVESNKNLKLNPIFITINTSGQIITKNDPEYWSLKKEILLHNLPTKNLPEISDDKTAQLWLEDNAIMVNLSSTTYKVIQPDTIIRSVGFYKNRSDVVIFSTSNAVYAIEVNKAGKQNFMPIYKGASPYFIKTDPSFIYMWDNETLMQVII